MAPRVTAVTWAGRDSPTVQRRPGEGGLALPHRRRRSPVALREPPWRQAQLAEPALVREGQPVAELEPKGAVPCNPDAVAALPRESATRSTAAMMAAGRGRKRTPILLTWRAARRRTRSTSCASTPAIPIA